jgi:RNA ligase
MKYDLKVIADYVSKGLVIGQAHSTLPLAIFNYSRTCQYDRVWDEITLNCRGLILDTEGNVVAKPFPKFFNYEEHTADEIPNEYFDVYEKMDGSLGICFHYNGEWHMATRGSFTSDQAIKGKDMLDKLNTKFGLIPGYTYLFEIIYPENRIVVDYGGVEKLVVLGCYNNETGEEGNIYEMVNEGFEVVTRYNTFGEGFDVLKKEISNSKEGYVIRFKNGMRMKIKGDEYVRLHRILTNFSTTDIWELLRTNGNMDDFLERVPDEFDKWVRSTISDLKYTFFQISERAGKIHDYFRYGKYNDKESEPTKKEFALHLEKSNVEPSLRSVLFAMWDGKSYDDIIWKLIKPKWSKPFKKDVDN